MKYIPKEMGNNVNISSVSPVKDFWELVIKIIGIILLGYLLLGITVDFFAARISTQTELKLNRLFMEKYRKNSSSDLELRLQQILNILLKNSTGLPVFPYTVNVTETKEVNALALPGGNIIVFSALLKNIDSQNEISMVLAHELGHYYYRDHLRGLGRRLVLMLVSLSLFGSESSISRIIGNVVVNTEMRFSQVQEIKADLFALDLLNKTYGNVVGATDFYEKMARKEKTWPFFNFFATHPYPARRIEIIKKMINKKRYTSGSKISIILKPN